MHDEIEPPDWVLAGAQRLDLKEFGQAFIESWRKINSTLQKTECWQTYQEPETKSWSEYRRGNFGRVLPLLEAEADYDQEVYEDVKTKDKSFIRLRLVKRPLSEYLEFEIWNYLVRARRGETIMMADLSTDGRPLPNHSYFDFLLLDEATALIHDYGTDGLQVGGWVTRVPEVIERLKVQAKVIQDQSVPLREFISKYSVMLPPEGM